MAPPLISHRKTEVFRRLGFLAVYLSLRSRAVDGMETLCCAKACRATVHAAGADCYRRALALRTSHGGSLTG